MRVDALKFKSQIVRHDYLVFAHQPVTPQAA